MSCPTAAPARTGSAPYPAPSYRYSFHILCEVVQQHEGKDPGRVGGTLDRRHVVVGMRVLVLAGTEIRGRDAGVVEVALVEGRRRVIGLDRRPQHDFAGPQ